MNSFWSFIKHHETASKVLIAALLIPALVLGVLWTQNPDGNYEPYTFILGILGALVGALTAIAHRIQPDPPAPLPEPSPPREKPISEMSVDEIFSIVEESDPRADWVRSSDMNAERVYHRKYPSLRFVKPHDDSSVQSENFQEQWARQPFSDPHAVGFFYKLYLGDSELKNFILVSVDGHRALLPLPNNSWDLEVDPLDYKVALINDEAHDTESYFQRAGLRLRDA